MINYAINENYIFNIISAAHILFDDNISGDHVIIVYATDKYLQVNLINLISGVCFGQGWR